MADAAPPQELPDWIAEHIKLYQESGGKEGHIWQGVPTLLLTTTGRRSGRKLLLPLIYGRDGDRLLVVASKGGAPAHPAWYTNLVADPNVQIQVGEEHFAAKARTAMAAEKPALWEKMAKIFPNYNEYQAKTERPIPVVIIERA